MKSQIIKLHSQKQIDYANKLMAESLNEDDLWCVEIKKHKEAKTLQQLRGLFGTWYDYLENEIGLSKDELHDIHKTGYSNYLTAAYGGWLCEIYYENPQNPLQQLWAELRDYAINDYNQMPSAKTLGYLIDVDLKTSLSWATIDQMREYMNRIEHYYMNAGYPLPILEKYQRWYR
jgi:hypothetical protein